MESEALNTWKKLAIHNFIPKALIIGVLGNLINFVIISRPCIRSSTNIFFSIMTFVDTSFMLLIYLLLRQYYDNIHHESNEIYWRMFGLIRWFYTAFMYSSVYLALFLMFDRYTAVCHPTKPKYGIAQTKNLVSMILLISFLLSISTAFEYQLITKDELCRNNESQSASDPLAVTSSDMFQDDYNEESSNSHEHNVSFDNDVFLNELSSKEKSYYDPKLTNETYHNLAYADHNSNNDAELTEMKSRALPEGIVNTCSPHFNLYPVETSLAKNKYYRVIFKSFATILLILPLSVMIVLGCLLSPAVCRKNKLRHRVVAQLPSLVDSSEKKSTDFLIRQNKITFLVITLVATLLICHTPNAVYLSYETWFSNVQALGDEWKMKNVIHGLEISSKILMFINCSTKIFVYLLLYDEYWTSIKSLKNCFQSLHASSEIIHTSKHLFPSSKIDVETLLNYSLNKKRYSTQITPEAHYKSSLSTFGPRKQSVTSNSSNTPRLSLVSSLAEGFEMKRLERHTTPQMEHETSFKTLHLSPSQNSLTRSKSLNIQSAMKHSPNCRLNKKF
ncbi:CLUMA_CG011529, isoform A [Clunio marinus]|uniref:CLUMA_CG011529, isoform A n=1 Tax=Clunio marinus TaxID=568069 RepID=A0A1J1ID71_9DIPT|nr:CLUMA_CG011529, isoform A [Clunio marinus]